MDFPGSQAFSAAELIKASQMTFHITNEKFSPNNPVLRDAINEFQQGVWNEALLNNRTDIDSINEIAWQHLGGDPSDDLVTQQRSEAANILWESGLRIAGPNAPAKTSSFNDTLSMVARLSGDTRAEWFGQANPLMIVFYNYALEGSSLTNVQAGYDPSQGNLLHFAVKGNYEGTRSGNPRDDLYAWTSQFSKDKIQGTPKEEYAPHSGGGAQGWRMAVILNNRVINAPTLTASLRDGGTISGRFTQREVNKLAADLKAGSLSYTPRILSEENVSPDLGRVERRKGIVASLAALSLVVVVMVSYYRFAGVIASCAVLFNILIMWGVLQNMGAALTLPGIAGIVLTIGMAVDANVLVFERIREEFRQSGRIASAIQTGYRKAYSAIVDSNVTTVVAALILLQFDSGPIKGFAVTLIIGILSSMFTALFMTRYFFSGWVKNPKNKELRMSQLIGNTNFNFLKQAPKAVILSLIVIIAGGYYFIQERNTLFGMDFTGGYSINVELEEQPGMESYRIAATDALLEQGATVNDFEIRQLNRPNQLRIHLGIGMEEKGHPFHNMPQELTEGKFTEEYLKNPRITWVVNALENGGLKIQPTQLDNIDKYWSVMSGQFSQTMRNNALWALGTALAFILLYITIRFEFKYAISAVIGLAHDVIISLGLLALIHTIGSPVQIDLAVVGAVMTIIGYSLNDTIIVFDRIREDHHLHRKWPFADVINHALNITLSRTILTSFTTLVVLFTLVLLGGAAIFTFSLVMTIGVFIGTLSSLFVAGPVLLYFHNREQKHQELAAANG